jgi:toxin HigB-1
MIHSFADRETESLFRSGKSRRLPPALLRRAILRMNQLDHAGSLDDLRFPPSNRLEALRGERAGTWSLRINDQWRLCFRFEAGDAFDVEIVDYH